MAVNDSLKYDTLTSNEFIQSYHDNNNNYYQEYEDKVYNGVAQMGSFFNHNSKHDDPGLNYKNIPVKSDYWNNTIELPIGAIIIAPKDKNKKYNEFYITEDLVSGRNMDGISGNTDNTDAWKVYRQGYYSGLIMQFGLYEIARNAQKSGYKFIDNYISGWGIDKKLTSAITDAYKTIVYDNDPNTDDQNIKNYYKHNNSQYTAVHRVIQQESGYLSSDFINPNVTNFKYMAMLRNYFNFTYDKNDYTTDEQNKINEALSSDIIQTILPKITKIKLHKDYTFIHKYAYNCYVANNILYCNGDDEENIVPNRF